MPWAKYGQILGNGSGDVEQTLTREGIRLTYADVRVYLAGHPDVRVDDLGRLTIMGGRCTGIYHDEPFKQKQLLVAKPPQGKPINIRKILGLKGSVKRVEDGGEKLCESYGRHEDIDNLDIGRSRW
jgi:hypothetical protein